MFPITLRPSKSDRSLTKLKKGKTNLSWSSRGSKALVKPELDFTAFHSGLALEEDRVASQITTSFRRARCISTRNSKRDTILIDLTNNEEFAPALDYAFAILDADDASTRSLPPPPPPKTPILSRGSSSDSGDMPCTPSTSTFSPGSSVNPSVRSAPPRYVYISSPLSSSSAPPSIPSTRTSPHKRSATTKAQPRATIFDPDELSLALAHAQSSTPDLSSPPASPSSAKSVPFPPPAAPPAARVPLLQRKPRRVHSAESSFDGHCEPFVLSRSCPGSSKVSLARSVSSLDHHRDVFGSRGACLSTTSVNTVDSTLSALLARQPAAPRTPYASLRLFSSPKKPRPIPARRASTPPPSRARLGIPSARPPVPALPDAFLLGPAARREAVSASNSLLSRSHR